MPAQRMAHDRAYILCATPRSGTTLLCDLLSATARAGRPQSYFRRQDIERRARMYGLRPDELSVPGDFDRAYLQATLREGAGETGVFGLRLMWDGLAELARRLSWLQPDADHAALFEAAFGPLVYVHVSRRDKLAQAISLLKAEQSGLWHVAADGSERQRTAPAAPVLYDGDRIAVLVAELERDDAAWRAFFRQHAIAPLQIAYESLVASPHAEVGRILQALGLPREIAEGLHARTSRMADAESRAWSERYHRERGQGRA